MINLFLYPTQSMSYRIIWMLFVIPSFVFSVNDLHRNCSQPFTCGDQTQLFYPFWIPGREACGHPYYKLDCSQGVAEVYISSVKFRILNMSLNSPTIRLARSDYINNLCPPDPLNERLSESVLQPVPGTDLVTLYYDCNYILPVSGSAYFKEFGCGEDRDDERSYFETRNLTSPLPRDIDEIYKNFTSSCKRIIYIPASGPSLNKLQNPPTLDNLQTVLKEGFELRVNQECSTCLDSKGACGYNSNSDGFACYCEDGRGHTNSCGSRKGGLSTGKVAGMVTASGLVVVFLIVTGLFCLICRRRKTNDDSIQHNLKDLIPLKHYSYAQIMKITKSFDRVVGKGGFGTVYKGTLCDGRSVAVKVLKDSTGNEEDFVNEVASMSKTSHVNIVDLLGFCSEGSKRAILYEFLENGSLDRFISRNTSMSLDWTTLFHFALGVARALEYLHHGCKAKIVHFDIKPQNILLDDNLSPKVSDFGLAKLCKNKESIISLLGIRGTIGYIAPEVFSRMYGSVSQKSDVYSYGMLVLEMIGARDRKTSDQNSASNTSSMYFPEWIYKDLEKGYSGRLTENEISSEEEETQKKMTLVGLWCIQSSPSNRPSMNRVVEMMEGNLEDLKLPPRPVLQQFPAMSLSQSRWVSEESSSNSHLNNLIVCPTN